LRELPGSELLFPFGFDFEDDFADRFDCGVSSGGEVDAFGALVGVVVLADEVSELLQLAEEVVERLFGHSGLGRELGGALVLGAGVLQHVEVRGDEVCVAALAQAGEHPVSHGLGRHAQQRADQRWRRGGGLRTELSKVT